MPENREPHPAPAQTDQWGQRTYTPPPAPDAINRNFGAPYQPEPTTQPKDQ